MRRTRGETGRRLCALTDLRVALAEADFFPALVLLAGDFFCEVLFFVLAAEEDCSEEVSV